LAGKHRSTTAGKRPRSDFTLSPLAHRLARRGNCSAVLPSATLSVTAHPVL